ncbi:MAG: hypothetical protein Q9M23_03710 [Mariprofundaceae bacterium]|nr:hypothetical protein [Mariprofundaceae bacterium]
MLPTIQRFYLPLAERLRDVQRGRGNGPLILSINGAQGSGKSTLAAALAAICKQAYGWQVAILSMDDLYLSRVRRQILARDIHPLLATRGVPGTHDVQLGIHTIAALRAAGCGDSVLLPRFDKAQDEPVPEDGREIVNGPIDLIVFEGWCLGAEPQTGHALVAPCNELERLEDADGLWRRYVNRQLAEVYPALFAGIDVRVFLKVPDFESVLRWRSEQEEGLDSPLMGRTVLRRFVLFFERLTRHQLKTQPAMADVVFELDRSHGVAVAVYREGG